MIRTYLDNKLIRNLKYSLDSKDKMSKEFDYYKSIYYFLLDNKKNEIFIAEKNSQIQPDELESMIKRDGGIPFEKMTLEEYQVNTNYDFKSINKSTILFFIDFKENDLTKLEHDNGLFFSNCNCFVEKWKKVSLRNTFAKSITISFRDYQSKVFDFSKNFSNYNFFCNSIIFVDRYLRNWTKRAIMKNLVPFIKSIVPNTSCKDFFLTIITSEQEENTYPLSVLEMYKYIEQNLKKHINLHLSVICIKEYKFTGNDKIKVQNIIHDRHIITNYLHLSSQHSLDINGENGVKKDTEITIKSLLESSHFSNSYRKRKSYKFLINSALGYPDSIEFIGDHSLNSLFKEIE